MEDKEIDRMIRDLRERFKRDMRSIVKAGGLHGISAATAQEWLEDQIEAERREKENHYE